MKIAIVILNWNGEKLLKQFIPSLLKYNTEFAEIYVADNASSDNSINFIQENFPNINIVKNQVNGGYAKGYNDALQHIKADIYCLINSDIEVTNNWLLPIISEFKENNNTAIIQPKILDYKNKGKFEYAGAAGGYIDKFGYPYCRGRLFNSLENDVNQYNDICEITWASGACFFIRSNVFKELKGFDEHYFAHQEEIDLCWRAKNKGYTIKYVGLSTVYHVGGATLKEHDPKKTYLNFRNNLLTLLKNLPNKNFIPILFFRLILDGIAGIKFACSFKFKHVIAIIKAHFNFYKNIPSYYKKRKDLIQKENYYKHKSVVWQYFILKRKKFEHLK